MDGWIGLDGSLGLVEYRAPYDANNRCHDNFDQNFGNFDDNDDKKYWKNLQILLILGKILPFRDY